MVNFTNSNGNSSDTTNQGGKMERNYKDDDSSRDEADWRSKEVEYMKIQDHTSRSTTNYEYKYPQVRKTGVNAVHGSCP